MRTTTLSSDILEAQFGPTAVEVLWQDGGARVICTRAGDQVLELSQVRFRPERFPAVSQAMAAGASMGKALHAAGIDFTRDTAAVYKQVLPAGFRQWFGSDGEATVVAVTILAGPDKLPYAEILETYSPAVHWPAKPHGQPGASDRTTIQALDDFLLRRPRQ